MLRFAFESVAAGLLFATALVALFHARRELSRFSLVAGLGTVLLASDEALDLHEAAGREMYRILDGREPPLINHWDDLFVISIGLVGLVVVAWFRREILADVRFARLFGAGLAVYALAILWDSAASTEGTLSWWTEEAFELGGGSLMLSAFAWRWKAHDLAQRAERMPPSALSIAGPIEVEL